MGFGPFFQQQLSLDEFDAATPARVTARDGLILQLITPSGFQRLTLPGGWRALPVDEQPVVGDWLLLDAAGVAQRLLERSSFLARRAAGHGHHLQPMAANLSTLFIVTSCNQDFNPSRLERYLTLAQEGGAAPVIVLTKADLLENPADLLRQAQRLAPGLIALALDARQTEARTLLAPWLGEGETVAFVGSSGVGKSTLINTLRGEAAQATGAIREDDAHGRHTTTSRQLLPLEGGAWLLDTPGMRELRVEASDAGLEAVFADVAALAERCRFRDCGHQQDDGCAVRAAVDDGEIDVRRLENFLKLQREQGYLRESAHESRDRQRKFSKMVNSAKVTKFGRR
ncbi:putative GTPase EngC [Magnetofaba australis IT-1]|uniref:Small ribosomal subunit biogenesis GTPase RsgA n=2 Tax=Magnetofaba TaxID=1472292 RepID=A0A1Y2KB83_9PROT|nr:putative GTPase EngC [Magnetofaba australis IT-1]